jgi:hypothetical protein
MKTISRAQKALFLSIILTLMLAACGQAAPTLDAAAVATSAVQTVEARFTEQAAQATPTQIPPTAVPPTAALTGTPTAPPLLPTPTLNAGGTAVLPCLSANFLYDVTIPDGMIIAPGATFTKKWRVKNTGTCPWDSGYKLTFASGNAMGTTYSFALPQIVNANQEVDISIDLVAPTTEGYYEGYWRLSTPFGGTIGFGLYDSPLSVKIQVATKGKFAVTGVTYSYTRDPVVGCPVRGAVYTFYAVVTANAEGDVAYHWERNPTDDEEPVSGTLTFKEAGSKTVTFEWTLKPDALQGITRWVALYIDDPNDQQFERVEFVFSCP